MSSGRGPELIHIRTRRKSPGQNGVRESAFGSLKYEHLYRHEIDDGHDLDLHIDRNRQLFNQVPATFMRQDRRRAAARRVSRYDRG